MRYVFDTDDRAEAKMLANAWELRNVITDFQSSMRRIVKHETLTDEQREMADRIWQDFNDAIDEQGCGWVFDS